MPLFSIFFYSLPESYLIFVFGLTVIGEKILLKRVLLSTAISVVASYIIRLLPLPFGVHTFLGLITVYILFRYLLHLTAKKSFIATLSSLCTLLALENSIFYLLELRLNLTTRQIWEDQWLRTVLGWPHLIMWSAITLFLYRKKINFGLN